MNIEKKIKEIEKNLTEIKEELKVKSNLIECPIAFEIACVDGQGIGLPFGKNQVVVYDSDYNFNVDGSIEDNNSHPKIQITPIKQEDFKPKIGHWYYATDSLNPDFNHNCCYKCYISNREYFYVSNDKSIIVSNNEWDYYYPIITKEN